ncbi:PREDICTED: uncharacterized protein LOC108685503 [Atta colombica]|uniref:uncharacterized protein LOC108685503 n=1 Tax=Atta colombica TaxID=520822 RepID=UPI00084CD653|nr:PREDICTED: uncharacterized protein LOC108685503 [Atta colombica]
MSINLYYLLSFMRQNITNLLSSLILVTMHFIYMFGANFGGQIVTDHNDDIFKATCNALWYIAPLSSQKIFLFLIHHTMKSFKPLLCNIFVASLEGFVTLVTTSLSYLTILYSIQ